MGKKKKKETDAMSEVLDRIESNLSELEVQPWDEDFGDSDHSHYMRMSAETIQLAGNIAAATGDTEKLLVVSEQWGKLARLRKDLDSKRNRIGFANEEEEE